MSSPFVSGIELSRRLYADTVRPLLSGVAHSAALLGPGSEVLGFDTVRSTDHDWGPRLQLFLTADDLAGHGARIGRIGGVQVAELGDWLGGHLGFDPLAAITWRDWLATSTQHLAEVTRGAVFHDGLGLLSYARDLLTWYPDDLWRYVLACQWQRIGQEDAFVGRCGEVGDELGSAVVAGRVVRDLMRLCLLIARSYPPYSKWLGSAFARLPDVKRLHAALIAVMAARDWHEREDHLVIAYEMVAKRQNDLGLAAPVDPRVRLFHDRPFRVLRAERFVDALMSGIGDPVLRALPLTGAIDQFADSTDLIDHASRSRAVTGSVLFGRGDTIEPC